MGQIGEKLKNAREQKNLTLREAEKETKIRISYLEALENEEFDKLPGRVYTMGFLRNYADFLGLDASAFVEELKEILPQPDESPTDFEPVYSPRIKKFSWIPLIILFLILAAAAIFIYQNFNTSQKDIMKPDDTKSIVVENNEDYSIVQEQEQEQEETTKEIKTVEGLELEINVLQKPGARSWMRIDVDGNTAFSGFMNQGEQKVFQAKEKLFIHLGYTPAVNLNINGSKIEIDSSSNVWKKTITLEEIQ